LLRLNLHRCGCALFGVALAGCGGQSVVDQYFESPSVGVPVATSVGGDGGRSDAASGGELSGGPGAPFGGTATAGSTAAASGGMSGIGGAGNGTAGTAGVIGGSDGSSGAAGTSSVKGGAGDSSSGAGGSGGSSGAGGDESAGAAGKLGTIFCSTPRDCPTPSNMCLRARCSAGICDTENVAAGSLYVLDVPADCHATIACDGLGGAVTVVDQTNAPTPYNSCEIGTCDRAGIAGAELLPPRSRCASVPRGLCDGAGNCVECLNSADCPAGLQCAVTTHTCGPGPCTDAAGDCGGVCAPCAVGFQCLNDSDCESGACDANTLRCVSDPCADHRRDRYETDVDCGGVDACPRCASGKICGEDGDCELGHPCTQGRVCQ